MMPSYKLRYRWDVTSRTWDALTEWPLGFKWVDGIHITFWFFGRALRYHDSWGKYPPEVEPKWQPFRDLWQLLLNTKDRRNGNP